MRHAITLRLLLTAGGFLSGSIMFSKLIPQYLTHKDICAENADHNPGTANVFASCGVALGLLCLALDMAKGFLPVFVALQLLDLRNIWFAWIIAAPVLGHALAPLNHFHGGKCIATTFGVLIGLVPVSPVYLTILAVLYIFFSTILKISPNHHRSITVFSLFGLLSIAFSIYNRNYSVAIGCCVIALTAIIKHLPTQPRFLSSLHRHV